MDASAALICVAAVFSRGLAALRLMCCFASSAMRHSNAQLDCAGHSKEEKMAWLPPAFDLTSLVFGRS